MDSGSGRQKAAATQIWARGWAAAPGRSPSLLCLETPRGMAGLEGSSPSTARHAGLPCASACPQACCGNQGHLLHPHLGHRGKEAGQWEEGWGTAQDDKKALRAAATTLSPL